VGDVFLGRGGAVAEASTRKTGGCLDLPALEIHGQTLTSDRRVDSALAQIEPEAVQNTM
jgi:hypothetical protein